MLYRGVEPNLRLSFVKPDLVSCCMPRWDREAPVAWDGCWLFPPHALVTRGPVGNVSGRTKFPRHLPSPSSSRLLFLTRKQPSNRR